LRAASLPAVRLTPFTRGEIKILMSQNHTSQQERKENVAVKNLLRSLGPCSLSKPRQQGDNYQSLEDHFLKLPPLAYYTLRTYIFYSNFAVPFKLYLIKASHFCQLPHALLTMEDGTSPRCLLPVSHTYIPPKSA
jgi:hypothetical protein